MRATRPPRPAPSLRARSTPSTPTGPPVTTRRAHRAYRRRIGGAQASPGPTAGRILPCHALPGSLSVPARRRHRGTPALAFAASRRRRAGLLPTNQRMNEYQPSAYCRFSAP
ncbi:conserved hypothetical protein [Cupriavidus taiwanensis]|nr:conserved hypothetical protein [Cupriavidus taiwanensis]SPA31896.1 conserved hypothetical protein [Cupriavidus taiwanensis]